LTADTAKKTGRSERIVGIQITLCQIEVWRRTRPCILPSQRAPTAKRPRGRPPSPGGPKPKAEIQRAYRARLAAQAADTAATRPDPKTFVEMREKLHNALLNLELREQDVARLEQRNAYLERELKLQAQHHTNALKDIVLLKRDLARRG
jgi:hypothetical protein